MLCFVPDDNKGEMGSVGIAIYITIRLTYFTSVTFVQLLSGSCRSSHSRWFTYSLGPTYNRELPWCNGRRFDYQPNFTDYQQETHSGALPLDPAGGNGTPDPST